MEKVISAFKVGESINTTLLVINATARETKAKKPYLSLVLTDGNEQIACNYWDWTSGKIPPKNAILDVKATVTEWQDKMQLNIGSLSANTEAQIEQFVASGPMDPDSMYKAALNMALQINDPWLRDIVSGVLAALKDKWVSAPGAVTVHHAYKGGTLMHCMSVACTSAAISEQFYGSNRDLCIAGGLLHDVGKLFTYFWNGAVADMTDEGKLFDHTFLGARFISNFIEELSYEEPLPDEYVGDLLLYPPVQMLLHIILSHHGSLEHGAAVPPLCVEAAIVAHVDELDAVIEMIRMNSKEDMWTERIYFLNNKPHLSTLYTGKYIIGEN